MSREYNLIFVLSQLGQLGQLGQLSRLGRLDQLGQLSRFSPLSPDERLCPFSRLSRFSPLSRINCCEKRLTVWVGYGVLDRTQCQRRMEGTNLGISLHPWFEKETGPGLEPVGGEFQPRLETGYPGGGAHLIFGLTPATRRNQLGSYLSREFLNLFGLAVH